jgi:hypothetical protein
LKKATISRYELPDGCSILMRGPSQWAIFKDNCVFDTVSKEWVYEPLPSSRSDEFKERTRFETEAGAYMFWEQWIRGFQEADTEPLDCCF